MTSYACSPNIKTCSLYILISHPTSQILFPWAVIFIFIYIFFFFSFFLKRDKHFGHFTVYEHTFISPSLSNLKKISSNNGEINNCVIEVLFRFFHFFYVASWIFPLKHIHYTVRCSSEKINLIFDESWIDLLFVLRKVLKSIYIKLLKKRKHRGGWRKN